MLIVCVQRTQDCILLVYEAEKRLIKQLGSVGRIILSLNKSLPVADIAGFILAEMKRTVHCYHFIILFNCVLSGCAAESATDRALIEPSIILNFINLMSLLCEGVVP